jgi:hypothetical protein
MAIVVMSILPLLYPMATFAQLKMAANPTEPSDHNLADTHQELTPCPADAYTSTAKRLHSSRLVGSYCQSRVTGNPETIPMEG